MGFDDGGGDARRTSRRRASRKNRSQLRWWEGTIIAVVVWLATLLDVLQRLAGRPSKERRKRHRSADS